MNSKERFSDRVADYVRNRPNYPAALIDVLREELGLDPTWVVADVGSGTGLSAEPFLEHGNVVFAVEPNADMRSAAERRLGGRRGFRSIAGSAEATGLDDASVDLVVAGQAFHWFDPRPARVELARILRTPKRLALFWNTRVPSASALERGYEALLRRFGVDYEAVRHDRGDRAVLDAFFGDGPRRRALPNEQLLDRAGLEGRLRSSSYTPPPGHPDHAAMMRAVRRLFDEHQSDGRVRLSYQTEIFTGTLA